MALIDLARRSTRLPLPPLLSVLCRRLLRPSPPLFFSSSAGSAPPPPPTTQAFIHNPSLSSPNPQFSSVLESDSDDPVAHPGGPHLVPFLRLVSDAKSRFSAQEQALAHLKSSSDAEPTEDLVCSALWELRRDWESAALVFKWAGDRAWGYPPACCLMLSALGRQRRFSLAWSLLRRMREKSVLTIDAMVIMMERYAAANEANKAIKTFHSMEKFKLNADTRTFYALLHALCKNRYVEEAEELLLLNRKFFPLETEGFNIVLDGWCNVICDVVEAKRVWREMSNCCINPDATSYSHMICCFSRVGNLFDSIRLYDEMKKRSWTPDIVVYNSLIYVLTRENCLKEARKIFHKLIYEGLKPNLRTYNSMIYPLCERHNLNEVRELMGEMIQRNIVPNLDTYHAFAKVEDIDETLELLKNMRDVGCGPNSCTFLLILDKFFKMNECENALRIWSEMKRYNVIPDSSHYTTLVQGLTMHGWIPKAMELYNEMLSSGFHRDPKVEKIFSSFLSSNKNHWGRGKEYIIPRQGKNIHVKGVKVH